MKVSVIMANYRGAQHLFAAITSVLRQTHADLEVIVSDDASPDGSVAIVREAMARDARVRLIEATANSGPAAARNRGLEIAAGDWIAVVDSDDLMHCERIERLVAAAVRLKADVIADDLLFFGDTVEAGGRTLLQPLDLRAPLAVTTALYLEASGESGRLPPLGYLKPLIRRRTIGDRRYDETLRIGEDYDFVLRLLMAGARCAVVPDPMYLYRRHTASISHRLTEPTVGAMLAAHDRLAENAATGEARMLARRRRGLLDLWRYQRLVDAIQGGRKAEAAALLVRHPGLVRRLGQSLRERLSRAAAPAHPRPPAELRLGLAHPSRNLPGALYVPCPPVPAAGDTWPDPPWRMASALSRLSSLYRLTCIAEDEAGAWAAGLLGCGQEGSSTPAPAAS